MTNPTIEPSPTRKGRRNKQSGDVASASELARHLDVSRAFIGKLEAEGIVVRQPGGGYSLDANRVRYVRHLRRARQQSPKTAADAAFIAAKTRLLELRVGERERVLMRYDQHLEVIHEIAGIVRTAMSGLPARAAGRDLAMRRRVEAVVNETLQEISDECGRRAAAHGEPEESDDAGAA